MWEHMHMKDFISLAYPIYRQLVRVEGREWPSCMLGCSRSDVFTYYEISSRIEALNSQLQV